MMRRTSLRPRQIDIHAKMRIIRSDADLLLEEDPSNTSSSTTTTTTTSTTGQSTAMTFNDLVQMIDENQSVSTKPKKKKHIPIPVTFDVKTYEDEIKDDFIIPTSYVRFQTLPPPIGEETKVEVDLEIEEMRWLRKHPKFGEDGDPRYQISLEQFEKMLDVLEKACVMINPNVITLPEAEEVLAKQLGMYKTPLNRAIVDVYTYWCQKRQKLKRPLLRKYWPQTPLNDTNPHLVFRPREKERYKLRKHRKNDMEGYRKMQQLKSDFERMKSMMDLVKRREKCKRLEIDFLDEIRRQVIHELTTSQNTDTQKRIPQIPVEEDRHRKKKKKNKHKNKMRQEVDENGQLIVGSPSIGLLAHNSHNHMSEIDGHFKSSTSTIATTATTSSGTTSTTTTVEEWRIPTFMEYDTSKNYKFHTDKADEEEQNAVLTPTYPLPSSHVLAHMFMQPTKYRCRGRIGRGGRLIIDRIPVAASRFYGPSEIQATTFLLGNKPQTNVVGFSSQVPGATTTTTHPGQHHSIAHAIEANHAAVLVNESAFRPVPPKVHTIDGHVTVRSARLQEIYNMSDSEDEWLEPMTAAIIETKTKKEDRGRSVKFALNI